MKVALSFAAALLVGIAIACALSVLHGAVHHQMELDMGKAAL